MRNSRRVELILASKGGILNAYYQLGAAAATPVSCISCANKLEKGKGSFIDNAARWRRSTLIRSDPMSFIRNTVIRQFLCGTIYYSGILAAWQKTANKGRSLVVSYHEIFGDNDDVSWCQERSLLLPERFFRAQINYLNRRFRIVGLHEAALSDSPGLIAITFDDGYRNVYQCAFPILKSMNLPATVFVTTEYIGSEKLPWWDVLMSQLKQLRCLPAFEQAELTDGLSHKWKALLTGRAPIHSILAAYKIAGSEPRRELKDFLSAKFGHITKANERIFLSEAEICEMAGAGIDFGAHSKTHPILTWLDDKILLEELQGSKESVERLTGSKHHWFAYPDGVFTDREKRAVEELGFLGAVQTYHNPDECGRFAVPRIGLKADTTLGVRGRPSRGMMEITLADLNKKRFLQKIFKI